jgi:hypothetical protein
MKMQKNIYNTRKQAVKAARGRFEADAKKYVAGRKSKFTIKVGLTKK